MNDTQLVRHMHSRRAVLQKGGLVLGAGAGLGMLSNPGTADAAPSQIGLKVWDVTSFGADPTGKSDSTTNINNAISTAITAGGGIVYIPVGTYHVNGTLTPGNNVLLMGAGPGSQIIGTSASGDIIAASSSTETYNVTIRDLLVWSSVPKGSGAAISATRVRGLHIQNVLVGSNDGSGGGIGTHEKPNNLWDGIYVRHPFHARIENCIVRAQHNGIIADAVKSSDSTWTSGYPYYAASDMWVGGGTLIRDCTTGSSSGGNGILIQNGGGNGLQIEETDIYGCTYGMTLAGSVTDASQVNGSVFIGHCFVDSCIQEGIVLQNYACEFIQIEGTWCASHGSGTSGGSYGCGIWVSANQYDGSQPGFVRLNAIVSGCRLLANHGHGLYVNKGAWNVTGTTCHGNGVGPSGGYGLYARNLDRFGVVGNVMTDNSSGGINLDASNVNGNVNSNTFHPTAGSNPIIAGANVRIDTATNVT